MGHGLDCSRSGLGEVENSCEYGNDASDSIKCEEFLN